MTTTTAQQINAPAPVETNRYGCPLRRTIITARPGDKRGDMVATIDFVADGAGYRLTTADSHVIGASGKPIKVNAAEGRELTHLIWRMVEKFKIDAAAAGWTVVESEYGATMYYPPTETHAHIAPVAQPIAAETPAAPVTQADIDAATASWEAATAMWRACPDAEVGHWQAEVTARYVAMQDLIAALNNQQIAQVQVAQDDEARINAAGARYDRASGNNIGRDGAHYPSFLAAEAAHLALLTREARDLVVTAVVPTPAGDVAVREFIAAEAPVMAGDGEPLPPYDCMECGDRGYWASHDEYGDFDGYEFCEACPVALEAFDAARRLIAADRGAAAIRCCELEGQSDADKPATLLLEEMALRECLDDPTYRLGNDEASDVDALAAHVAQTYAETFDAHQQPAPLPLCRICGNSCASHAVDWCGCMPPATPAAPTVEYSATPAGVTRFETTYGHFDSVFVEAETLPFTPDQTDDAEARAELLAIETAAGVTADEPPPDEMELQIAEVYARFLAWCEVLGSADVADRRADVLRGMLDVERFARLRVVVAVPVGMAA